MPKPVLSDSLFNADDVATAVLAEANLQVTNQDLGVTSHGSSIATLSSGWGHQVTANFYSFNGFMFFSFVCEHAGGSPAHAETFLTINDSDYYPIADFSCPSISYQGDNAYRIQINTSGEFKVLDPGNSGASSFYICCNAHYRFT
jgi:hypothetical protein